jgi:hypothetical protein
MCCVWMAQRGSRERCARVCKVKRFGGGGWFAHDYRSLDMDLELARSCTASYLQTSIQDRLSFMTFHRKQHRVVPEADITG